MPFFDVVSEMNWQELTNAVQQTLKESESRFDFKGVSCEIEENKKDKFITLWCNNADKLDALKDIFFSKAIKRGISTLSFVDKKTEDAFGGSRRLKLEVQVGIPKEKAKQVVAWIKESKLKVTPTIQDEKVRITGKNKDDLQSVMGLLKEKQHALALPLSFTNFRDA
jgi:uncharacterized protein YajQ (UPF0234 family)